MFLIGHLLLLLLFPCVLNVSAFLPAPNARPCYRSRSYSPNVLLRLSFFDDLFGANEKEKPNEKSDVNDADADDQWDASGLKAELNRRNAASAGAEQSSSTVAVETTSESVVGNDDADDDDESEFDGYALRDAILEKFGVCWDVDFQRVESYGFRKVYLNILPFKLGSRRFRHSSEYDYLCHLQAVVEILQKYDLLDSVLVQLEETKKKPRPGTSPLVAVPLRLDLTPEQIDAILGPPR